MAAASQRKTNFSRLPRLPSRVIPFASEPTFALAARLARRVGAGSLAAFAGDWQMRAEEIVRGRKNPEIAALMGIDVRMLERVTFILDGTRVGHLGGEVLEFVDWSPRFLKICPDCVREDLDSEGHPEYRAHIKSWWNLASIGVCPFHRVAMLNHNPTSGQRVDPWTTNVRFAAGRDCDFARLSSASRTNEVDAEKYILGRLGFMPRIEVELLDTFPLNKALRLMEHAGAAALGGAEGHTTRETSVEAREALKVGYRICVEGTDGLIRLMEKILADAGYQEDDWAPRSSFGVFYNWLFHGRSQDRDFDSLREVIGQCVAARSSVGRLKLR